MINEVLISIETIAIFFQGFSFRRMNMKIMLLSSFIILLVSGLGMILNGIGVYTKVFSNIVIYDVIVSIVYVLFWFISGYIIGGFQRVTTENVKVIKVR
jgi:hypothetical protein